MVRARARGIDSDRRARTRRLLATVRRGLAALAPVHGRKSLLLFSPGFLEDSEPAARDVVAASRDAGTAVYFLNVRGLVANPGIPSAADPAPAPNVSASGALAFEDSMLDSAGARALAEDTGGFSVVNTNDLAAGAERISEESRVFYLLGFQAPPGRPPGAWRKLHVTATRAGLTVRARRGYTLGVAAGAAAQTGDASAGAHNLSPVVEAALDSVEAAAGIPLRAMPYVFEPRPKGTARVVVAVEFDASRLDFQGSGTARAARLEVTVAVTQRDTGRTVYSDGRVEVRVPEGAAPAWRAVARELELTAGVAQARAVVRDPAANLMGAVSHRFEVPRADVLRLSTPIVTEHVDRGPSGHGRPRAALAAHRVFRPEGSLYCEFEVFGATRDPAGSAPRVSSGVEVRRADGRIVHQAPPTRIAAERDGRVVRLVGLGLDGMEEGAYELMLEVRDEVGGGRVERREPFTLAR